MKKHDGIVRFKCGLCREWHIATNIAEEITHICYACEIGTDNEAEYIEEYYRKKRRKNDRMNYDIYVALTCD